MIQFNLLPDVKQQYVRAKRLKHTTIVISMLAAASALFIFIMLFLTVHVFQTAHLHDLDADIKSSTTTLQNTTDLNKILTIQNQLNSLPGLHDQKPQATRLFTYITQLTPNQVSIGKFDVDFDAKSMTIAGTADSLGTINQFVDTMKFTTYTVGDTSPSDDNKPFTDVVLSSFGRGEKESTYSITLKYNAIIFDSKKDIKLVVPKIISTRSETEKPNELFKALPDTKKK